LFTSEKGGIIENESTQSQTSKIAGMKVLVTGANGLLGANLVRELIRSGVTVKGFVRPSANLKGLHNVPCEICRGEILSYDDVHKALLDCDAVVHAASTTSVLPLDFAVFKRINVDSTKVIVQAALSQGNKRVVYISTAAVFGAGPKENPGTEQTPFALGEFRSGYVDSKVMAQDQLLKAVTTQGLNAVVVNPTFMIGPCDVKPSSGKIILQGLARGIQWCPKGGKNFVHVKDVAQGIFRALTYGKTGECYLLAGENLTYKEFFLRLNKIAGRTRVQVVLPRIIFHTAGALIETWNQIAGDKKAFTKSNAKILTLDNYYSGEKAIRELKITPSRVDDAISDALEWFRKENYISDDNYSIHGTNFDL
jgi:dihydroflavonol-4-reductase